MHLKITMSYRIIVTNMYSMTMYIQNSFKKDKLYFPNNSLTIRNMK